MPKWMFRSLLAPLCLSALLLVGNGLVPLTIAAAHTEPADGELETVIEELERHLEALQELRTIEPDDRLDPRAILDQVGPEPAALFEWVRHETHFVAYRGAVRGPIGVLMDRRGNSLDRALLLNELLTLAGHGVRMVRATLEEATAVELSKLVVPIPHESGPRAPSDEELSELASRFGRAFEEIQAEVAAASADQQRLAAEAAERTRLQSEVLLRAVGTELAQDSAANRALQVEALRDHWWVQLETADGWQDLDVTVAAAAPGDAITAPQQGLVLTELAQLGPEWLHQIDIRVVVEVWEEGSLREEVPLEVTVTPAERPGELLLFRQLPSEWPEDLDIFGEENPLEALRSTLLEQQRWAPGLVVAGELVSQQAFTLDGKLSAADTNLNTAATGGVGMGVGGMFGGFGGAAGGDEPAIAEVTAQWLEFELRVPGNDAEVVRRPLFDLLGDGIRRDGGPAELELSDAQKLVRAVALYGETELLPLVGELPSQLISRLRFDVLIRNLELTLELLHGGAVDDFEVLLEGSQRLASMSPLYGLAHARTVWSEQMGEVYVDRPNLIAYHRRLSLDTEQGLARREGFDIILNWVGVLGDADPFEARLEQGVLDTNAEALLLSRRRPTAAVVNASEMPLTAPRVLTESADAVSPSIRPKIEAELAAGYVVVLPEAVAGRLAWWRVDPVSGTTLGMGETGWGQAMTEYTEQVEIIMQLQSQLEFYHSMGECLGWAITQPLRGVEGPDADLRDCVFSLICGQITGQLPSLDTGNLWTNKIVEDTMSDVYDGLCAWLQRRFV